MQVWSRKIWTSSKRYSIGQQHQEIIFCGYPKIKYECLQLFLYIHSINHRRELTLWEFASLPSLELSLPLSPLQQQRQFFYQHIRNVVKKRSKNYHCYLSWPHTNLWEMAPLAPLADAPEVLPCSVEFFPVIMFKLPKLPLDLLMGLFSFPSKDFPSASPPPVVAAAVPWKA